MKRIAILIELYIYGPCGTPIRLYGKTNNLVSCFLLDILVDVFNISSCLYLTFIAICMCCHVFCMKYLWSMVYIFHCIIPIFGQEQPLPDPIHQFCEKHLPTIKSYIDKLSTILPLPVKCTVEGKCVTCHHKTTHDVYNNCETHYVVYYNHHKTTQCVFIHHKTQDCPCCIYIHQETT